MLSSCGDFLTNATYNHRETIKSSSLLQIRKICNIGAIKNTDRFSHRFDVYIVARKLTFQQHYAGMFLIRCAYSINDSIFGSSVCVN